MSIGEYVIEITFTYYETLATLNYLGEKRRWNILTTLVAYAVLLYNPLKERANKRSIVDVVVPKREILEKFVQTFKLSRSSLPTGGTLCYCCLSNLKKWDKMITEITVIQEQLKRHLTQSPSCSQAYRTKRTLSEAEREDGSTSPQNSLIPPEAEQTDTANRSIDMSVRVQLSYSFVF